VPTRNGTLEDTFCAENTMRPTAKRAVHHESGKHDYAFERGIPTEDTAKKAYDDADLDRAIQAYRFFYPTVSGAAIIKGNKDTGLIPNQVFGILEAEPTQLILTANSDTPYGWVMLDLGIGAIVVELPPGPLIVCAIDVNQRWVADMGLPGPDAGNGGKHVLLPPDYSGDIPTGVHAHRATSNRQVIGLRALPLNGDVVAARALLSAVKVYPLDPATPWTEPAWIDLTGKPQDTTPLQWEDNFEFWEVLHDMIEAEPAYAGYHNYYDELAVLGIEKGKAFEPPARTKHILEEAARVGNAQMRVQSFGDRRPDRIVWPDRKWQWASLRYEDGDFNVAGHTDLAAREKWFFQAIGASPAMFRRDPGAGSLYWLGLADRNGTSLNGAKSYRLSVPLPVPARLFWSVTVYDTGTRSQVQAPQNRAALRSLFELKNLTGDSAELYFGPVPPRSGEEHWIQTIPGKGWFAYFRIYGPETPAFDGSWKPGDFDLLR
jgi:hypothetical protein